MPFYLILANVAVAGQWFLYGVAINNSFVQVCCSIVVATLGIIDSNLHHIQMQVPNLIGCLIASFQLALFAVFPANRTKLQVG